MAIEVVKILHGFCLPVSSNLLQKRESSYTCKSRFSNILQVPTVRACTFGKSSFRYAAPVLWNSLPDDFRNCSNLNQFLSLISS